MALQRKGRVLGIVVFDGFIKQLTGQLFFSGSHEDIE